MLQRNNEQRKKYCENQKLWISIDETIDVEGRYIANVIIGTCIRSWLGRKNIFTSHRNT